MNRRHRSIVTGWALVVLYASAGATAATTPAAADPLAGLEPELVAISVANVDVASKWYCGTFGFREAKRLDLPDHALRIVFAERDGFRIELIEFKDSVSYGAVQSKFPSVTDRARIQGFGKLAFRVDDLDALVRHLKTQGAKLEIDVTLDKDTNRRWLVALDPDGNWIQVFEAKRPGPDQSQRPDQSQ
jgi:glyoxylase I family protein